MVRTAAQEAAFANRMLARADHYLAQVDEAYILKERGHTLRPMPTFRPEEISIGAELGRGGFGVVREIRRFTLDPDEPAAENNPQESSNGDAPKTNETNNDAAATDENAPADVTVTLENVDNEHYAIGKARQVMSARAQRNGKPRYALKMLHSNLAQVERARGMIDLALEAKYLSIVWHPNISKCRNMSG